MAWRAAASAAWWRRALAWARNLELSAWVIAGTAVLECFEGGDDPFEVGLDAAQVLGEAELAVGVGLVDQAAVGGGLPPVDLQELGVVWKSGQVRQAFGCGQSCWAGRPQ